MAFQWTEKLSVGYELIDQQHQELLRRINRLLEACRENRGRDEVAGLLDFLGTYVLSHFAEEEKLMDRFAYPESLEHKKAHRLLTEKFQELKGLMEQEGPSTLVVIQTNHTLLDWVLNHIKNVDVRLGSFLQARA